MRDELPKLSGANTFFYKRVFPTFWFGFLTFVGALIATQKPLAVLAPAAMMAFGYFLFRHLVWDLADDVRDGGSFLLVRNRGLEQRIELRDVMNVGYSQFTNPRRIVLKLRTPGPLGDEIVFTPPMRVRFKPFTAHPLVDELIARVDAARRSV
jgi:hypothetical protein